MAGSIKIWPVHSRKDYSFFIAHDGKPHYFRTYNEALLFAKDARALGAPKISAIKENSLSPLKIRSGVNWQSRP